MEEFKRGQSVYDTAGYEYYYNQKLENGHLVNKVIEVQLCSYDRQDFYSEYDEGEAIILHEIFSNPPKQKKCDEILALDTAIKALQDKEALVKKSILEENKKLANVQSDLEKKIKEFPHHNKILRILNNDFPLFYINGSGVGQYTYGKIALDVETGEVNSLCKEDCSSYYYIGEKDSYETLEDAEKAFLNNVCTSNGYISNYSKYYENAKALFEKYNEEVPEYILQGIESFKQKELDKKLKDLKSFQETADKYLEMAKTLEKELET